MKVALISPYEIGRQPFALAQPAAWLEREGFEVCCIDLSIGPLDPQRIADAGVVAIHLAMHTGARLAAQAVPVIAAWQPRPVICVYGLYAPVNDDYFRALGAQHVFGGESETDLVALCSAVRDRLPRDAWRTTRIDLGKIQFIRPQRNVLPKLDQYATLTLPDGRQRTVGFAESSRGCKHLCRHCPVVPVYAGTFRIVPVEVVIDDIRQQVAAGAQHISFGDPDFLNGPKHALRVIKKLGAEFPHLTWDATVKIEHIKKNSALMTVFAAAGCLFITSAAESLEDEVLIRLDKGHDCADFKEALQLLRNLGIAMIPTFVPFTPWTTLNGYLKLLSEIAALNLVGSIVPVQLGIRLLLPRGSPLLSSADRSRWLGDFDPERLGYQWRHPEPAVDALQAAILDWVMEAEADGLSREDIFTGIWSRAHQAAGRQGPELRLPASSPAPQMSEPWYCCAEPTAQQRLQVAV